jgi:hypothetical protein
VLSSSGRKYTQGRSHGIELGSYAHEKSKNYEASKSHLSHVQSRHLSHKEALSPSKGPYLDDGESEEDILAPSRAAALEGMKAARDVEADGEGDRVLGEGEGGILRTVEVDIERSQPGLDEGAA